MWGWDLSCPLLALVVGSCPNSKGAGAKHLSHPKDTGSPDLFECKYLTGKLYRAWFWSPGCRSGVLQRAALVLALTVSQLVYDHRAACYRMLG